MKAGHSVIVIGAGSRQPTLSEDAKRHAAIFECATKQQLMVEVPCHDFCAVPLMGDEYNCSSKD